MRLSTFALMSFAFVLATVGACSRPTRSDIASEPSSTPSPPTLSSNAPPTAQALTPSSDAPSATIAPSVAAPEPSGAALVPQNREPWPFKHWNRAEVLLFNRGKVFDLFRYHAYDDQHGWSPTVTNRKRLTKAQALEVMQFIVTDEGDVRVSACPEPEHAVVFFDGNTPVGNVNVSFACGDILLWPKWDPEEQEDEESARQQRQRLVHKKTLQKWERFFRSVGHSIEAPR